MYKYVLRNLRNNSEKRSEKIFKSVSEAQLSGYQDKKYLNGNKFMEVLVKPFI